MNRIELKNRARENVRKDRFTIILITLLATAIMSGFAISTLDLPGSMLFGGDLLTVAPTSSVQASPTAKGESDSFDLDDFFNDDGEFDADYYFGNGENQLPNTPFQNPFADGDYDYDDYGYGYGDYYDDRADLDLGNTGLALAIFLISGALMAGLLWYHLKIWRGEEGEVRDLFSKFNKDFPRITKMYLLKTLFVFLWTLLLIVPGIIMAIAYSQAYFLMLDDPDLGAMDALDLSKQLMKGRKWDYFVMLLSFLGWFLLGILTLGILFLWIDPYVLQTLAGYYNEVIKPARIAAATAAETAANAPADTPAPEETTAENGVTFTDVEAKDSPEVRIRPDAQKPTETEEPS